ncbi:MAG: phosphoenolpyruvate--protein phosphotransferase [Planctomycetes bacterium]|jgi:phosphotransferase system enzyme I (PtsI)|nr:phosphoenolpyruvate--protein phosphotransferase [Planctomycetota bacterium]MBL6909124.1 phosphoenolpyruvate--protein phosphotransferase [Pirellulales bacterium]OUV73122.1 MAG: phosphoenolpyruvate--protein phosphotransferase [Planctomycetaceae bacterium TMED138]RZO65961.1 MAG: phosphoenolpyruvate--protein phosphotransferase [Phycisphaeraceae bacterium]HAO72272.1 phosphoenolpyruvate--protein phosphotransferase [Planctomycetaceae bacterium]|tara:strand:- start:93 stop:1832 length:1740 start_codon:yes stop_codon:yes gene_type:complete
MLKLQGIAVSSGVTIGEALVLDSEGFRIPRRFVARSAVDTELQRLSNAIAESTAEIKKNRDAVREELGEQYAAIFDAHLAMLHDQRLQEELTSAVRERNWWPEYAVSRTLRRYAKVFQKLDNHIAQRAHDIYDIEKSLLRNLLGQRRETLASISEPVVILAHNLTPSETANLDRRFVKGFATELGGPGSHTAIVAEGLEIPAVVGIGPFLADVSGGEPVILDGNQGVVILQPDEETIARYRLEAEVAETVAASLGHLRDLPAETVDGVRVQIRGNIEFPEEVEQCKRRGSDGIGLYRTEFLYLTSQHEPSEEDHYRAYSKVIDAIDGKPMVVRTLDLGSDKMLTEKSPEEERNPCLGLRSIRLSLRQLPMFRTQLRAILRASSHGDVRVMFPLVSTIIELRQARLVLADVMEDLAEHDIDFNPKLKIGIMVETPAAAMMLDAFIKEVDFVSVGTNDLIQYTLAVDRGNKDVADLYSACDPAVIRLLKRSLDIADDAGVSASVCGQMSGSVMYTQLLLGLGLRELSVPAAAIPEIKQAVRSVSIADCQAVAKRVLEMNSARDVKAFLRDQKRRLLAETVA